MSTQPSNLQSDLAAAASDIGTVNTDETTVAADTAKLNWQDPDKIKVQIDSIKGAVYRTSGLQGWSASETEARMKAQTSGVHVGVIDTAFAAFTGQDYSANRCPDVTGVLPLGHARAPDVTTVEVTK